MTTDVIAENFVSVATAAQRLGVTERWLWEQIRRGKLRTFKPGPRCTLIDAASLDALIAERQADAVKE